MFPDMKDFDEWTQELREAGCCVSGFTLKVRALQILRELAQYSGTFLRQMVGSVFFCVEKTLLLGELPQPAEISPLIVKKESISSIKTVKLIR
jgi:hypothetical protein